MTIEDNNPERRNLVLLSMAITAFYIGGCEIPSTGEIELPLVKLKFTDAYHLACLVWIMLGWFTFRYWITARHEIKEKVNKELHLKRYGLRFFDAQLRQLFLWNSNVSTHTVKFRRFEATEDQPSSLHLFDFDEEAYDGTGNEIQPDVRSEFRLRIMLLVAMIKLFVNYPSLSAYYAPYILVFITVSLGVYNMLI